ncbi:hypothetical protein [Embleya sp. AB8]
MRNELGGEVKITTVFRSRNVAECAVRIEEPSTASKRRRLRRMTA